MKARIAIWPPRCSFPGCTRPGLPVNTKNPYRKCEVHLVSKKAAR